MNKGVKYSNRFKMRDLFANPQLANVFPQFDEKAPLQNVYSFADTERRVLQYLKGVFNGTVTGDGELTVKGKHENILRRTNEIKGVIETFFNSMPTVVKGIRHNTNLYLPYSTLDQIADLNTSYKKLSAMKAVLENIMYNPDFQSTKSRNAPPPVSYAKKQEAWKKKVDYKE